MRRMNSQVINNFAKKGAMIVKQHPYFPTYLITEIETYRGCFRSITGGCSFCSEPSKGIPSFRTIDGICTGNRGVVHCRDTSFPYRKSTLYLLLHGKRRRRSRVSTTKP